jgi:hypothetical protein
MFLVFSTKNHFWFNPSFGLTVSELSSLITGFYNMLKEGAALQTVLERAEKLKRHLF